MTQSAGKDGERELANRLADLDSLSTQLTDSWYSRARKAEFERDAAIERAEKASQAENDAVAAFHLANQARDKWRADHDAMQRERASLRSTITQKDEEIERLEAALRRLAKVDPLDEGDLPFVDAPRELEARIRFAEAALSTPETGETK